MNKFSIDKIDVGSRHRKDMGDIKRLADSIREVGLLHPVVITPQGSLIAGERRLRACRTLGWTDIPVTVVPIDDIVRGELAENALRKDFLPSEIDAIRRAMEPVEKAAAEIRMKAGTLGKISTGSGKTRDKIGSFAGVSGKTVDKISQVVAAAKDDPELEPLVEEMDRTRTVEGAFRKLKQKQDEQKRLSIKPVVGKYRTLVIDPPWDHEGLSIAGRGRPEYAVMSHEELLALPVAQWADDECHLYLWTTNNFFLRAGELIKAWGFDYKTCLTWVKPRIGLGSYFRSSTEHCLFAVRGKVNTRVNNVPTHFTAPTSKHSSKPDEFFDIVERASYPPYLEYFEPVDGRQRDKWMVGGV
jgi:N6-adenosine-specific RNA methylase IME4/ParB-like chromosome segregation protein Spo0J